MIEIAVGFWQTSGWMKLPKSLLTRFGPPAAGTLNW